MKAVYHGIAILLACLSPALAALGGETAAGNGFSRFAHAGAPVSAAVQSQQPTSVPASPVATASAPVQPANETLVFSSPGRERTQGERRDYRLPSILPAMLSVAVICGLFLVMLYLIKKYLPGHRQLFSHPAMEVLGRTHLDQRRYVSLIRVGKRIVVVGVSPDEMRALSEITDDEEITSIMEVARPKTEAGLTVFQRLFQRNVVQAEREETTVMAAARAEQIEEQMASLKNRVRGLGGNGRRPGLDSGTVDKFG